MDKTRIRALIDLGFAFERDILDYGPDETPVPVWPDPSLPEPSQAEIDAKEAALADEAKERQVDALHRDATRALALVLFNHENRIRVLEGKQAISAQQFRSALKDQME
jgi:hypothetical protein